MNIDDFRTELHQAIDSTPPQGLAERMLASAHAEGVPAGGWRLSMATGAAVIAGILLLGGLGAVIIRAGRPTPSATTTAPAPSPSTPVPTPDPTPSASPSAPTETSPSPTAVPSAEVVLPSQAEVSVSPGGPAWVEIMGATGELLFRSGDNGATWQQRSLPAPAITGGARGGMSFVGESGWLGITSSPETQCNAQGVETWRTTDGARTWQNLGSAGIAPGQCKHDLSFVDGAHGFLAADDPNHRGLIYRTVDGGATWSASDPLPDPPGQTTRPGGFSIAPGMVRRFGTELYVGATGWQRNYVYRSTDGGAAWSYLATPPGTDITKVSFLDRTNWWLSGGLDKGARYTVDAGAHWIDLPGEPSSAAPIALTYSFADRALGYATVRGQLWVTGDGGRSWATLAGPGR